MTSVVHRTMQMLSAVAIAAVAAAPAHADFSGLSVELHNVVHTPTGVKRIWRVYANFTSGDDRLNAWGNSAPMPADIRSLECNSVLNGNFFQHIAGGNTAPSLIIINVAPLARWDTFATIGVSIADQGSSPIWPHDQTILSPGFPTFINGNQLALNGSAFVPAGAAQGQANYAPDGDPQLRVLMMQLTTDRTSMPVLDNLRVVWASADGGSFTVDNLGTAPLAAFGLCCTTAGICQTEFQVSCFKAGGTWLGCGDCSSCSPVCPGNIAGGDNAVDVNDLLAVIGSWGDCPNPGPCPADIHPIGQGNGQVDVDDLLAVISAWGPCP